MGARSHVSTGEGTVVRITIGADGRLYWHDLTPEMLEIAAELCPEDPALRARIAAQQSEGASHEHDADAA